jgi:hypothetical protein
MISAKTYSAVLFCALLQILPALPVGAATPDTLLVNHGDAWRYRKGTSAPQADWKTVGDAGLDGSWLSGPGGFGYADGDDATVLSDMLGAAGYTTLHIRRQFVITEAVDPTRSLRLTVDWDDAYVVYLDGVELRRSTQAPGAVGVEPAFNATATTTHEASGGTGGSVINLGAVGSKLGAGTHVLSVIGLNDSLTSSDFSLIVDLAVVDTPSPPLVAAGGTWRYFKGSTAPLANWQTVPDSSLGASWLSGPGGFGYGDGDDATVLSDMLGNYTTVYIRQTFNVATPFAANLHALLSIDYDDGFVAYLDGAELARQLVPGTVGVEPPNTVTATTTHEATGGGAPLVIDLGLAATLLSPGDHVLAIVGVNESLDSSDMSLVANLLAIVPPPPPPGAITVNTTWTLANSPYVVSNNISVASGVTLTIEPGVTVLFNQGRGMTVNGRLVAEGTAENQITFTRNAGATSWSQLNFTANNTTSRIAHAHMSFFASSAIEANGTTMFLDTIAWTDSTEQVVDVVNSSLTLLDSIIPGGADNEPVHFSGMPANGHALIKGCVFGAPRGYNDNIDFTGGNRPGPIAQFIDNVFLAAVEDCLDMDATDARHGRHRRPHRREHFPERASGRPARQLVHADRHRGRQRDCRADDCPQHLLQLRAHASLEGQRIGGDAEQHDCPPGDQRHCADRKRHAHSTGNHPLWGTLARPAPWRGRHLRRQHRLRFGGGDPSQSIPAL